MKKLIFFILTIYSLTSELYLVHGECWKTGCQPDSWLVKGCEQYNMNEVGRSPCSKGYVYSCCKNTNAISDKTQLKKKGDLTYYNLGLTACGQVYTNSDMVAAIAFSYFTSPNPNIDPMCGKQVKIIDPTTLKSIKVTIRDKCEGCKVNDIDVSPSAFEKLKPKNVGRFQVVWDFI